MPAAAISSDRILFASPGERRVLYADGGTTDIIRAIQYADKRSAELVRPGAAARLRGATDYDTLRNIYGFVKSRVKYTADRPGMEVVRSPAYLLQTGQGDCKSLSVAIAALCRAEGIPYSYRFIQQSGAPRLHHVYVVATPRDGSAPRPVVILDAVFQKFDSEPAYRQAIDLRPGQRPPAGLHGESVAGPSISTWSLLSLLAILFFLATSIPGRKRKSKKV